MAGPIATDFNNITGLPDLNACDIAVTLPEIGESSDDGSGVRQGAIENMTLAERLAPKVEPSATAVAGVSKNECMVAPVKLTCHGPKFKLLTTDQIQVCRLNHTRTIISKIMNSKYLRRWETHTISLGEEMIESTTVSSEC